jgi:lysophospholipase L1-like esterase
MGIQLSSITGGSGYNYGADGGYADTWASAFDAFDYDRALEALVTDDPELSEYCYYVDTKGQFDTRYNMPYSNVAVNTRNTSVTEMRGTNGVHPSTAGYYQIGDAFYRVLHKIIPTITK